MSDFRIVPSKNERGAPIFSVLAKRSFRIVDGDFLQALLPSRPFIEVDQYWDDGDPTWSTVKLENDLAPYKVATDFVVVGKAYAPNGVPVDRMDASVEVGRFAKTVR